jgi:hypothetical protein
MIELPASSYQLPADERYTENDVPQPHVLFACGLLKMKPLLTRLMS